MYWNHCCECHYSWYLTIGLYTISTHSFDISQLFLATLVVKNISRGEEVQLFS